MKSRCLFRCSDLLTDGLVCEIKTWKSQSAWQNLKSKECARLERCVRYKNQLCQHGGSRNLGIKIVSIMQYNLKVRHGPAGNNSIKYLKIGKRNLKMNPPQKRNRKLQNAGFAL